MTKAEWEAKAEALFAAADAAREDGDLTGAATLETLAYWAWQASDDASN
jgi:hypothetical protein